LAKKSRQLQAGGKEGRCFQPSLRKEKKSKGSESSKIKRTQVQQAATTQRAVILELGRKEKEGDKN